MKNQKGSAAIWIVAILVVAIAVGGAYWHWLQNSTGPTAASEVPAQQTQTTGVTTQQPVIAQPAAAIPASTTSQIQLFSASPTFTRSGDPVPLSLTFSSDTTYCDILKCSEVPGPYYSVDFGDGTVSPPAQLFIGCDGTRTDGTCGLPITAHTYAAAGTYTAKLLQCASASDSSCSNVIASISVDVHSDQVDQQPATVPFSATPASGTAPLAVTFSGTISGPNPSSSGGLGVYEPYIDFGDGGENEPVFCSLPYNLTNYVYPTSCAFPSVEHTYTSEGTYVAVLHLGEQKGTQTTLGTTTINVR